MSENEAKNEKNGRNSSDAWGGAFQFLSSLENLCIIQRSKLSDSDNFERLRFRSIFVWFYFCFKLFRFYF